MGIANERSYDPAYRPSGRRDLDCCPALLVSRLSPAQIYSVARKAGFSQAQAVTATAIALAESNGGDPNAHCLNCFPGITEDSRGLWQINVDAHPSYASANLYDPQTNANAAYAISSHGRNFDPWSTYTSGSYRSHLSAAGKAASSTGGSWTDIAGNVAGDAVDAAGNVIGHVPIVSGLVGGVRSVFSWTEAFGKFLSNLLDPKFWLRIGQGFVAGIMLLAGLGLLFRRDAAAVAKAGIQAGKVAMAA